MTLWLAVLLKNHGHLARGAVGTWGYWQQLAFRQSPWHAGICSIESHASLLHDAICNSSYDILHPSTVPLSNHLLQSTLNRLPVNNIPNSTEVFRLPILVLQIIRMFPSINTQQRRILSNNWILIGICADLNLASLVVLYQPCPSAALDAG